MKREKVKEYARICIEHRLLKYADSTLLHDCPKCHTRYELPQYKSMAVDALVDFIMEIHDTSEVIKKALICTLICELGIKGEEFD